MMCGSHRTPVLVVHVSCQTDRREIKTSEQNFVDMGRDMSQIARPLFVDVEIYSDLSTEPQEFEHGPREQKRVRGLRSFSLDLSSWSEVVH
jgi:hypothetical protein